MNYRIILFARKCQKLRNPYGICIKYESRKYVQANVWYANRDIGRNPTIRQFRLLSFSRAQRCSYAQRITQRRRSNVRRLSFFLSRGGTNFSLTDAVKAAFRPFLRPKGTSWSRERLDLARRAARRKISDVLPVSSYTIYALLSDVNNNQPYPFGVLRHGHSRKALNPITLIFPSHSPGLRPGVILNYKWPLRFGNERSALPAADSSLFPWDFFANHPAFLSGAAAAAAAAVGALAALADARNGEHINPAHLAGLMSRYQRRVNQPQINRRRTDCFGEIRARASDADRGVIFLSLKYYSCSIEYPQNHVSIMTHTLRYFLLRNPIFSRSNGSNFQVETNRTNTDPLMRERARDSTGSLGHAIADVH